MSQDQSPHSTLRSCRCAAGKKQVVKICRKSLGLEERHCVLRIALRDILFFITFCYAASNKR